MEHGRYIYHYHAQYQLPNGDMQHIDGIMQLSNVITNIDDYSQAKSLIEPGMDSKSILVCSLSYLGREF